MFAILGATGRAGRATVRALRAQGHAVRAVVRDATRASDLAAAGCELCVAHLGDRDSLTAAFAGATAVQVICPVLARAEDAYGEMTATIEALAAALEAARAPAVVAISDYGAEVPDGTGVTLVFRYLEQRLRRIDAGLVLLRSAEHMQNWARQLRRAVDTGALATMHHPVTKPFPTVSAEDVGTISAGLLLEASRATDVRAIHVEGPRRYTAADVASAMAAAGGRPVVAQELPRTDWLPALERAGIGRSYAELVTALYDAHNAGRIDAELGGAIVRGTTELAAVIEALARPSPRRSP
jgi:uncharacterized protein YbjT (DUF2867 family)